MSTAESLNQFRALELEWLSIVGSSEQLAVDGSADWQAEIEAMAERVAALRAEGRWRSGGRTLLSAMGLQYREVYLTAGLAWLLTPDGWHGLGDRFLRRVLDRIGVADPIVHPVTVTTEESRNQGETRADLVVRFPGRTVLVEAKVFSTDEVTQCDRLARGWADESSVLVFLTRTGVAPRQEAQSSGDWVTLTWLGTAELLRAAAERSHKCAPGVHELLQTIERYGG